MPITLKFLLYPYFAFLIVWLIFSLVAVYHLLKFGFKNFATFLAVFLYAGVSALMLKMSYDYIARIDWSADIIFLEKFIDFFRNGVIF